MMKRGGAAGPGGVLLLRQAASYRPEISGVSGLTWSQGELLLDSSGLLSFCVQGQRNPTLSVDAKFIRTYAQGTTRPSGFALKLTWNDGSGGPDMGAVFTFVTAEERDRARDTLCGINRMQKEKPPPPKQSPPNTSPVVKREYPTLSPPLSPPSFQSPVPSPTQNASPPPRLEVPPPTSPPTCTTTATTSTTPSSTSSPTKSTSSVIPPCSRAPPPLPSFRLPDEAACQALLQSDPELSALYNTLVVRTKTLTHEEFWESRSRMFSRHEGKSKGLENAMLADIRPDIVASDACNKLRYRLSRQTVRNIFLEYPSVKKAYDEYVPNQYSEQEFWAGYFQCAAFHSTASAQTDGFAGNQRMQKLQSIFEMCANNEERDPPVTQKKIKGLDPQADVSGEERADVNTTSTSTLKLGPSQTSLGIIRKFNRHGALILGSVDLLTPPEIRPKNFVASQTPTTLARPLPDVVRLNDLDDESGLPLLPLSIQDHRSYFENPNQPEHGLAKAHVLNHQQIQETFRAMTKDAVKTCRLAVTGVPKTVVVEVLKDLAGTNKHEENTTASQESVPQASIEADLRSLFSTECELLRHFWACFPTDSAEKRYKRQRLGDVLLVHQKDLILKREQAAAHQYPLLAPTLDHLITMFNKAIAKNKTLQNTSST
ncbi:general transcription factor IIH component [Pelomyxa schiedti]|nr:general transcription factor IIH component [Pelomyxa schiedti]